MDYTVAMHRIFLDGAGRRRAGLSAQERQQGLVLRLLSAQRRLQLPDIFSCTSEECASAIFDAVSLYARGGGGGGGGLTMSPACSPPTHARPPLRVAALFVGSSKPEPSAACAHALHAPQVQPHSHGGMPPAAAVQLKEWKEEPAYGLWLLSGLGLVASRLMQVSSTQGDLRRSSDFLADWCSLCDASATQFESYQRFRGFSPLITAQELRHLGLVFQFATAFAIHTSRPEASTWPQW